MTKPSLHQSVSTWGAIMGAAVAIGGVVFTAGDASQRLTTLSKSQDGSDHRITSLERDVSDMKATLARIDQASSDTRDTVHRLERGHVYRSAGD